MNVAALRIATASLCLAVFLGGCATIPVGGPSSREVSAIKSGEAAIVLLRVQATENAMVRAVEIAGGAEAPEWPQNRAPSSELREEGWRYLVLPYGTYRLWESSPGTDRRGGAFPPLGGPSSWLNVPRGQSLLYAGRSERETAQTIARAWFADYGPLHTALVQNYGDPVKPALLRGFTPLALAAEGGEELASPDWWRRSARTFLGWYSDPTRQARASGCYGEGCALILLAYLAYLPFGSAAAAADADWAESKWGPCMEALAQELRDLDPMAELRRRLTEKLREHGTDPVRELGDAMAPGASAAREGVKGALQADMQRIQLRECAKGGTFCLEVAVRARLLDVGTGEPVYDTIFVVSNPTRRFDDSTIGQLYSEFMVAPSSACRELEAICGDGGRHYLREELGRALDVLVKSILPEPTSATTVGKPPGHRWNGRWFGKDNKWRIYLEISNDTLVGRLMGPGGTVLDLTGTVELDGGIRGQIIGATGGSGGAVGGTMPNLWVSSVGSDEVALTVERMD